MSNLLFSDMAWHCYRTALYGVALLAFLAVFLYAAVFNPAGLRGVR